MSMAAVIGTGALCAALVGATRVFRRRMEASHALGLLCATVPALIAFAFAASAHFFWEEIEAEGYRAEALVRGVRTMETYLASDAHQKARATQFSVCVLGDSTHESPVAADETPNENLRRLLVRILNRHRAEPIEIYGMNAGGVDAYDYYFLLNRIVSERPGLVVIPINLRSFGANWMAPGRNVFPYLERYLLRSELRVPLRLSSRVREFHLRPLLLAKLDRVWLGDRGTPFLRGTKRQAKLAGKDLTARLYARLAPDIGPHRKLKIPRVLAEAAGTYRSNLNASHPLFRVFREVNRLAAEHDIPVLYYAVQTPERRAYQDRNFALIAEILTQDPGVYFTDLSFPLAPSQFADGEHATFAGLGIVAGHLANEIVALRDEFQATDR